jgi:hypothetical protein
VVGVDDAAEVLVAAAGAVEAGGADIGADDAADVVAAAADAGTAEPAISRGVIS